MCDVSLLIRHKGFSSTGHKGLSSMPLSVVYVLVEWQL